MLQISPATPQCFPPVERLPGLESNWQLCLQPVRERKITVTSEMLEGMIFLDYLANMQPTGTLLHTRM